MAKFDNEAIKGIIEYDGLEYSILYGFNPEFIEDPVLAAKWSEAKRLLEEIVQILGTDPDDD